MEANYSNIPALAPPPGVVPNFVDPVSLTVPLFVASIISLVLAVIFVSVRLYSSLGITRSPGSDDYVCTVALFFSIAFVATVCAYAQIFTRHQWDIPISAFTASHLQGALIYALIGAFSIFFAKLSLFLLFLRLFSLNRTLRYQVYAGIALASALCLSSVIVSSVLCTPSPGQAWDDLTTLVKCEKAKYYAVPQGVVNVIIDFYLLYLPIPIVWNLNMEKQKKIGVLVIFLTGSIACIASILAMAFKIELLTNLDSTWNSTRVTLVNAVEGNIAIMCSSMPSLAAFLKYTTHRTDSEQTAVAQSINSNTKGSKFNPWNSMKTFFSDSTGNDDTTSKSQLKNSSYLDVDEMRGGRPGLGTFNTIRGGNSSDVERQTPLATNGAPFGGIVKSVNMEHSYGSSR